MRALSISETEKLLAAAQAVVAFSGLDVGAHTLRVPKTFIDDLRAALPRLATSTIPCAGGAWEAQSQPSPEQFRAANALLRYSSAIVSVNIDGIRWEWDAIYA